MSVATSKKDEEMGAISSGSADYPYSGSQFLEEQPPLVGQDLAGSGGGEWQIPVLGALPRPTQGFRSKDFRNPQTGESIVPTEVYVSLQQEVQNASQPYQWSFIILVAVVAVIVMLIPLVIIDFDDPDLSVYIKIACFGGCVLFGLLIWKTGMQWMDNGLEVRMERLVQERQGTLLECGVTLGYSRDTIGWSHWNRSHLWLRRIPESQCSTSVATPGGTLESPRDGEREQHFPPIFIHWLVPGEININEKEYDPSMVLDQDIWTMIQKAHFASFKPCNRYLAILMAALAILSIFYMSFIWFFMNLFGYFEAWLGYVGIMLAFFFTWFLLDRLNVQAWSQVADHVTLLLLNHENPTLNGTTLQFETSPIPFRNRALSRRYQLVPGHGNNPLHSSDHDPHSGKKVNHDDDDDEHHIL